MTAGGEGSSSSGLPGVSITRRTVLKVAGIASFLADGSVSATDSARAATDRSRGRSAITTDVATAKRTATVGGRLGRNAAALAIDGRTALVGVPPSADDPGPSDGRAVVLDRHGRTWRRRAILEPDGDAGQFGRAVALDDDTAVIGGELGPDPTGAHAGSVAVYIRARNAWTRRATLGAPGSEGVDLFGTDVDVAGDTVVVGASAASTDRGPTGAAFVFERAGGTWKRRATLTPPSEGVEAFGRAVAIDENTVVVGARRTDGSRLADRGVAFVYRRYAGSWRKKAELAPSGQTRDDGFGTTLAVAGTQAVVGAPTETNDHGVNAGGAYVFARRNGRWHEQATLRDDAGHATRQFATTVALDGDGLLVGVGSGAGPVAFVRGEDGWTPVRTLRTGDGDPERGGSVVALDGARALVGSEGSQPGSDAGSVEVFEP